MSRSISAPPDVTTRPAAIARTDRGERLAFVDNIRWTMVLLVLSMHACDTYGPFGSWYYREARPVGFPTALAFATYQSTLQAFFMALLFFVAGCFTVPSYDRKGFADFLRDRALRLGVPTLLYMLMIGPLTQYFLAGSWGTGGFGHQWLRHLRNGEWLSETGPMWFCAALLAFSAIYALLRLARLAPPPPPGPPAPLPDDRAVIVFIAAMAATTFLVRIPLPEGRAILNMQFGDFPSYILMFAAGLAAARQRWLDALPDAFCRRWATWTLGPAIPLYALLIILGGALQGQTDGYSGGFNLVSAGKCLWEALVCVGVGLALLAIYRRRFDTSGPLAGALSDTAFSIYWIHPPVLIALAIALRGVAAPALIKAVLLTLLTAVVSFAVAWLLRRTPLLRRIA
ncbi:MAG: acyltransferase [Pseudomonadota bacterium]